MGGGPSQAEREHQRRLEELQRQQVQQQQQFITLAATPDPLSERLRQRSMNWLDWSEGKSGAIDVTKAPGLGPSLDLYQRARAGEQGERQGIGALRMGVQGSDPGLVSLLSEQRQAHRERDAAGALEQAVAVNQADATGSIMPLVSLEQNKRMGLAGLASGAAQDTLGNLTQYTGRQRRRPFWQEIALAGWSQGSSLASGGMGG